MSEPSNAEVAAAEDAALDGQIDDYLTEKWEAKRADALATPDDSEPNREAPAGDEDRDVVVPMKASGSSVTDAWHMIPEGEPADGYLIITNENLIPPRRR